jgi:hypothetical protein
MSEARLTALRDALCADGWVVTNAADLLSVGDDDLIQWKLVNRELSTTAEVEFYVVGDIGERSDDLRDVRWGVVRDRGLEIRFPKITSADWQNEVSSFVRGLRVSPSTERSSV